MPYSARLQITVDSRGAERDMARFENRLERVERAGNQTAGTMDRTTSSIAGMRGPSLAATSALAGLTGALSAGQVIRYADAWTNTTNQIRQVTSTSEQLLEVQQKLVQVALDTRSNFESTANLYSRLARSTAELGLSQQNLLDLTTTINQSFAVSGATAQEAANAITQLSQGLSAGALRGEEFNSVSEQAPDIMRALAASLNMGVGELKAFAAEGGITAEVVVRALQEASSEIDERFGASIASFGQKMEKANTQIIEWVGTSETVSGAVGILGDSVLELTDNLDLLVDAGIGIAAIYGARLTASLASSAAGIVNNMTVTRAHTIALAENQAMEAGRAATMARTTAAEQTAAAQRASIAAQRAAQDRAAIAQDAQRLASTQAALAAERALETQRLQAQISATGRQQSIARLAELRASETAVTNQLTAANQRLTQAEAAEASAKRAATLASVEKTRAETAATAAMGAYTTAATAATRANGLLAASGRVAAGALALVGGPVGAAVIAGAGLYYFREELGLTDAKMQGTVDNVEELGSAFIEEFGNLGAEIVGAFRGMRAELVELDAGFLDMKAGALESFTDIIAGSADLINMGLIPIQHALNALDQGFADWINRFANAFESAGEMPFGMANLFGEQVSRMRSMADGLTEGMIEPIGISTTALESNAQAWREQAEAMRGSAENIRNGVNPAASAALDIFKPLSEWLFEVGDASEDAGNKAADAAEKTYTLADAYESLLDRITPNRREARQYAQDLGTLNLALASGRMTVQQYMQAMGLLQESFQAAQRETGDLSDNVDAESDRMATLWERRLERMDDAGVDMWRSFLDGSEDAFGSFRRLALDTLAEVIHAYTTQRITASLGLNVAGGSASGGGLSFNGIGSLISGGKSLLGIGSSTAAAAGGLYSSASTGLAAGGLYGNAVTGGIASTGIMSSITAGVSAAMPWIAGGLAIDSLLGGGITKAISGLFGGGKTNPHLIVDTRASNNYGHGSVREGAFGAVGFGQGTRRSNDLFGGIDKEREFLAAVAASDDLLASLARSPAELNRMAEAVQGVRLSASGVDGIMAQLSSRTVAAVSALDGEFGEFVGSLGADVDTIIARTQSAVAAMDLMGAASENLNLQFDASASGALRTADSIAQIAGGVEQLASLQDGYYQAYFSDAERAANLQRELTQALAEMGYALPSTRDGFRALVEQQNQLTESGQRNYVQLLQLAGAFDQMQTMLANAGSGVDSFADQLSRLNDEIGSLENDVRQAYQAFERQAFDQQVQLLGMMGDEQAALALQRERELLSIDPLLHETQRFIWAMEDEAAAKERVTQAAQDYRQEIERVRDQLGTALGGINQWIDQRNATGQTPGLNLEAAGEQFARQLVLAESGDRNALQSITQYADQYLAAGEAMFASGGAFQSIQQEVLSALQSLPEQISSEEYLAKEIRAALQDAVNSLPGGIADALHPMFDSIDLDTSGLIDWNEFYGAFQGLASDEELRRIFRQLDKDGSGTISRLEALNRSSEGTEGNTQTLEERARDQLSELGGLVSEMTRTTDQFVGLNSGISSLSDSINALGVTQAEVARIEKERAAAEKAERVRLDRERQVGELEASYSAALKEADYRMERRSFFMDATRDHAGSVSDDVEARVLNYIHENTSRADMTADERDQMHRWMTRVFGENSPEYLYALSRMGSFRNEALAREAQRQADTLAQQLAQISSQQSINGSHATGLWNVPFDNYIAELHRDEMVVPAETAGRLRELPNRELPMPTLPNFPLLNRNDQHDVVRDLLNENKTLRKELTALLKRIEQHGAAGVAVQQEAAKQQIRELKKSNLALDDMSAAARLEASR